MKLQTTMEAIDELINAVGTLFNLVCERLYVFKIRDMMTKFLKAVKK